MDVTLKAMLVARYGPSAGTKRESSARGLGRTFAQAWDNMANIKF